MFRSLAAVVLSAMLAQWNLSVAQDSAPTKTKPSQAAKSQDESPELIAKTKETTGTSKAKKRATRLPRYFGQLELSAEQRESAYSIQKEFKSQIDDLIRQIDLLKAEREKQLKAILSASQKRELTSLSNRRVATPKPTPKKN